MADPEVEPEVGHRPKGPKKGARASIQVDDIPVGSEEAAEVLEAASGASRRRGGVKPADTRESQRFSRAIRDPNNKIMATRTAPPMLQDGTALGDTYEVATHESQNEAEIKREISEARGGRRWVLRVFDPDDKIIASKSMDVPGFPRLDPMMVGLEDAQPEETMQTEEELTEDEILERAISRDPEVVKAKKNLALVRIKNEQEEEEVKSAELRSRRVQVERALKGEGENGSNGGGNGSRKHRGHSEEEEAEDERLKKILEAQIGPLKQANENLQKQLDEEKRRNTDKESREERRRELESVSNPLKSANDALQKQVEQILAKLNAPPVQTGPTSEAILAKLDSMKNEIKSDTKDQILTVVSSLTSKIDTVATTLNTYMAKGSDPATSALISLATNGSKGGAAPVDPYQGLERALNALQKLKTVTDPASAGPADFPSFLVEKMAETTPEVLNFFREQRNAAPTKEDIEKMMRGAAMKMYENLNASMKQELQIGFDRSRGNAPAQGLPQGGQGPAPAPAIPAPAPVGPTVSAPAGPQPNVVSFPGAAVPAATPTAPAPAAPAAAGPLTPEALHQSLDAGTRAEYSKRINWLLGGMLEEMKIGAREMKWPEMAHNNLPRPIIEQLVQATTDEDVAKIVKPYGDPKLLDSIWAYLGPANKNSEWYQDWLGSGIDWIKQAEGIEIVQPGEEPVVEDQQ